MVSLLIAAALLAADPGAASDDKKKPADPNAIVCKREKVSGSNMKQRVCMTAAQWEERREQDKDMVDEAQRKQPMRF
jgi:hypothetical protein